MARRVVEMVSVEEGSNVVRRRDRSRAVARLEEEDLDGQVWAG